MHPSEIDQLIKAVADLDILAVEDLTAAAAVAF
jgi:hypothetical protein